MKVHIVFKHGPVYNKIEKIFKSKKDANKYAESLNKIPVEERKDILDKMSRYSVIEMKVD